MSARVADKTHECSAKTKGQDFQCEAPAKVFWEFPIKSFQKNSCYGLVMIFRETFGRVAAKLVLRVSAYTFLEKIRRISLYVTDNAITKLDVT